MTDSSTHLGESERRLGPDDFEWCGEYVDMEVEDWWCPTEQRMVFCPGPCPDGTPHGPAVKSLVKARKMVRIVWVGEREADRVHREREQAARAREQVQPGGPTDV